MQGWNEKKNWFYFIPWGSQLLGFSTSHSIPKVLPSLRMGKGRGMLSFCLEKMGNILGHHKNLPVPGKKLQTKINTVLRKSRERFWGLLQLFEIGFSCKNDLSSCQGNGLKSVIFFSKRKPPSHWINCYYTVIESGKKAGNFSFNYPHLLESTKKFAKVSNNVRKLIFYVFTTSIAALFCISH